MFVVSIYKIILALFASGIFVLLFFKEKCYFLKLAAVMFIGLNFCSVYLIISSVTKM